MQSLARRSTSPPPSRGRVDSRSGRPGLGPTTRDSTPARARAGERSCKQNKRVRGRVRGRFSCQIHIKALAQLHDLVAWRRSKLWCRQLVLDSAEACTDCGSEGFRSTKLAIPVHVHAQPTAQEAGQDCPCLVAKGTRARSQVLTCCATRSVRVAVHTSLAERIPRGPYTCLHITGEDPWRKLRTPQQQSL